MSADPHEYGPGNDYGTYAEPEAGKPADDQTLDDINRRIFKGGDLDQLARRMFGN